MEIVVSFLYNDLRTLLLSLFLLISSILLLFILRSRTFMLLITLGHFPPFSLIFLINSFSGTGELL